MSGKDRLHDKRVEIILLVVIAIAFLVLALVGACSTNRDAGRSTRMGFTWKINTERSCR